MQNKKIKNFDKSNYFNKFNVINFNKLVLNSIKMFYKISNKKISFQKDLIY